MNRKQGACLTTGFLLLVVAALFPPWKRSGYYYSTSFYGFLFASNRGATLELSRLFVEWALIVLVTIGLFYLLRESANPKPKTKAESIATSEGIWRRLFSLSIVLYVLIAALGVLSYASLRKIRRLETGIQNVKGILGQPPRFTYLRPLRIPEGAVPIGFAPLGTVNGVPVITVGQANQMVQAEYDRVVASMQEVVEGKDETLKRIREELDKTN